MNFQLIRRAVEALLAAKPQTDAEARTVVVAALGEADARTLFNTTLADWVGAVGRLRVGELFDLDLAGTIQAPPTTPSPERELP